eukprot:TRINITY_DN15491_c0_g1::TRINITY_DN15491_c0_g1_i1::g.30464::m.30464 TRINITY_DN15491_c0_g1::TRINITY_DN15491_c0_g1_i1::g.30464  ORF type:complete len:297 (+),score=31.07,sp/P19623/SPEE_HUMAN/56.58/7e-117,Spermine_synth/PF01564.12/3.3e-90,Spermine_synth/PF01564.12/5.2e+02,Methyltransf_30/PF05430.6/0.012,Methyltransf_31/PF13847.1/0.013,Methyltransf_2/PF00891.13/7.1e+02,Methyltransf_2/PF00891.13/0.066,Methyltransf_18/PF12847.2/0.057,Methyltransf_12/PF08242.7/0.16 TRINITY_DN15491_c0_g1_i1:124-1014(+)
MPQDLACDEWFTERCSLWPGQSFSLQVDKVLHKSRSEYQDIFVFESKTYGRVLVLDGLIQVTERDEFAYQEMITHLPLFAHPNPKKVLVVGGGDGGVLREITKHKSIEEICLCELDEAVINVSKQFFPTLSQGFDDPRVTVRIGDGVEFLRTSPKKYDVIIVDSCDPVGSAAALFEPSFFELLSQRLEKDGVVCAQAESIWLHLDMITSLMQCCRALFPRVEYAFTTIPTYPSGQIGFVICHNVRETCSVVVREIPASVQRSLRYYNRQVHEAAFVLPEFARAAIYPTETTKPFVE